MTDKQADKNLKTQETSIWKVFKEPHSTKFSDGDVLNTQLNGIKRDDGFILLQIGMGREKQETFLCKGVFGEFRFVASRWDEWNNKPTDKYVVNTRSFSSRWLPLNREANEALILSHSKDIESALLHFPATVFFDNQPVKQVLFNISKPTELAHLVLAGVV